MTEDETFRILSRASFEEVERVWANNLSNSTESLIKDVKSRGWTFSEFCDEYQKRYGN